MSNADRKSFLARSVFQAGETAKNRFMRGEALLESGGLVSSGAGSDEDAEPESFGAETSADDAAAARVRSLLAQGKQVQQIELSQLVENPFNARTFYDEQKVMLRAASLAKYQQLVPALVCPDPHSPGKYIVIDGHYRLKGLQYNQAKTMFCLVDDSIVGDEALYCYSLELNEEREQQTALDNAFAWKRLMDQGVVSTADELISKGLVKASKANISKTLALLELSKDIQDLITQYPDKLGLHTAYEIVQLQKANGSDAALKLAQKVIEDGMSSRQTEEARKLATTPKERKAREESRQYKIKAGEALIGSLKVKDSGRVLLDVTLAEEDREALVNELKNRFGLSAV